MRIIAVLAGLVALVAAGCSTTNHADRPPRSPAGSWALISLGGEPVPDPLPPSLGRPTLTLRPDGSYSGLAGVNRVSGATDPDAWPRGEIAFGPMAVTRMAGTPGAMTYEAGYLGALDAARSFSFDGPELVLSGAAGELLRYEPAPAED